MKKNILFLFLIAIAIISCDNNKANGFFKRSSVGQPYELLVVCNHDFWKAPAGEALDEILKSDIPGLPQPEYSFRVSQTSPSNFTHMFKPFRNIIEVEIDPTRYTQSKFKYSKDKYATPQMVLTIQSPNASDFQEFITNNAQTILDFFTSAEMNRELDELKRNYNRAFLDSIQKKFGCDMYIPASLTGIKSSKDFLWASDMNTAKESIMSIVVYSFPYTDKNTFTHEYFVKKRNEILGKQIQGNREDRYMGTDSLLVTVKDKAFREKYMQEARGLWVMENDMMGGPFVSHSFVDQMNNRVIVAEAFVYAPGIRKGNMMRQLEAAIFSLKLPVDKEIENAIAIPEIVPEDTTETDIKE